MDTQPSNGNEIEKKTHPLDIVEILSNKDI